MTSDLAAALRRRKPERHRDRLQRRPKNESPTLEAMSASGRLALVPDANVYIFNAAGRLAEPIAELLDRALLFHCSVCLAELAVGVGNASPAHPRWRQMRDYYVGLSRSIPASRVLTPGPQEWVDAGLVAGTLARTQGFEPHQRKAALNDALILLTAARVGLPVLTSNAAEFDLIQQLVPEGQVITY